MHGKSNFVLEGCGDTDIHSLLAAGTNWYRPLESNLALWVKYHSGTFILTQELHLDVSFLRKLSKNMGKLFAQR